MFCFGAQVIIPPHLCSLAVGGRHHADILLPGAERGLRDDLRQLQQVPQQRSQVGAVPLTTNSILYTRCLRLHRDLSN